MDCLTGNFTICPPVLSQVAAVAAFTPESIAESDGHLRHYGANRELLLRGLPDIGIDRLAPTDGAFYVYADVSDFTADSLSFCEKLLADTGVAIAPGIDFDTARGGSFVRLSFAGPTSDIAEAAGPHRCLDLALIVSARSSRRPWCTTRRSPFPPSARPANRPARQPLPVRPVA